MNTNRPLCIIDADVHISPYAAGHPDALGNNITAEEALRRMDACGVERALVWLQPPYTRHVSESNRYVFESVKAHPDRFYGFGWANPRLGVDAARDEVKRCVEEYGFLGVKMNGAQDEYVIDDPNLALPVVEEIVERVGRIAFHIGADAYERTHPFRLGRLARQFPAAKFLLIHLGGVSMPDLSSSAIEVMRECPNVTGLASSVGFGSVANALAQLGADRICWGSDTPFRSMHAELAACRALADDVLSPEEQERFFAGTIEAFLDK